MAICLEAALNSFADGVSDSGALALKTEALDTGLLLIRVWMQILTPRTLFF